MKIVIHRHESQRMLMGGVQLGDLIDKATVDMDAVPQQYDLLTIRFLDGERWDLQVVERAEHVVDGTGPHACWHHLAHVKAIARENA